MEKLGRSNPQDEASPNEAAKAMALPLGAASNPAAVPGPVIFNVRDYGAQGDGATDDTASIQSALDAAGAAGGEVWWPPGVYLISTELVYYANTILRGVRGASVISNHTGRADQSMLIPAAGATVADVIIDALTFDQRSEVFGFTASAQLLSINKVAGITITHCLFRNVITMAVWCDTKTADTPTRQVRIENCRIENSLGGGISLFGNVQDLVLTGNLIEHCQDDAIALIDLATGERPANAVIAHNVLRNNDRRNGTGSTPRAILIYGCENVTVTDNFIDGTVASAISVQNGTSDSNHAVVVNNIVRNAGISEDDTTGVPGHGIMVHHADNVQVLNNIVVGSRQVGIAGSYADYLTVAHNRCEANSSGTVDFVSCTNVLHLFNNEAIPTFPGPVRFSNVSRGAVEMLNLTIADNGTAQFTTAAAYQQAMGIAFVVSIEDGSVAIFSLTGGNGVTFEMSDPQNQFSNTAGTALSTNIYNEGAPQYVYRIENKRGETRSYCIFLFMNRS